MEHETEKFIEYWRVITDMPGEELWERELRHAKAVVREVGEMLTPFYGNPPGVVKDPETGQLTSDMDIRASDMIIARFDRYFPEYGICEEESGVDDRLDLDGNVVEDFYCWVIDPLDSSHNYIKGKGTDYSILISLMKDCVPFLAVTYKPHAKGELLFAVKGKGVYKDVQGDTPLPIHVSPYDDVVMALGRRRGWRLDHLVERLDPSVMELSGTAKFLEVVKGEATVGYHPPQNTTKVWDLAPLQVMVPEAGGIITDAYGSPLAFEDPLYFDEDKSHKDGLIVANNDRVFQKVLEASTKVLEEEKGVEK